MARDIYRELPFASRNRCFNYTSKSKLAIYLILGRHQDGRIALSTGSSEDLSNPVSSYSLTHWAYKYTLTTALMLLFDSCTLAAFFNSSASLQLLSISFSI